MQNGSHEIRLDFFFTARGIDLQRTPLGMFRSLLCQLFNQEDTVRKQIREKYDQRCTEFGGAERNWEWPRVMLQDLFTEAVMASAKQKRVIIFVDALDESGAESARQIAEYFHQLVDRAKRCFLTVKVCISCRHYPTTGSYSATEISVEDHNGADITRYVQDKLSDSTAADDQDQAIREALRVQLIRNAKGVFQWVHLAVSLVQRMILDGAPVGEIHHWLREVPSDLEYVYEYILNQVTEARNRKLSYLLFQWVCLSQRPLSPSEIIVALESNDIEVTSKPQRWCRHDISGDVNDQTSKRIKALSGGLVEITLSGNHKQSVHVIHQSANEFLLTKGLMLLSQGIGATTSQLDNEKILLQSEATLYWSCVLYLRRLLVVDVSSKAFENLLIEYWDYHVYRGPPFLEYAVWGVFIHAQKAAEFRTYSLQDEYGILNQLVERLVTVRMRFTERPWRGTKHLQKATARMRFKGRPWIGPGLLHIATAANLSDLVEYMVCNGADIWEIDPVQGTALHVAAQHGHIPAAQKLLSVFHETQLLGYKLLVVAARHGHVEFVKWIFNRNPSFQATGVEATEALRMAAIGSHQQTMRFLIGAGADINARGKDSCTLLQGASSVGDTMTVQLLLDSNANVNAQGGIFGNALQGAAFGGKTEVVRLLLGADADVNAQGGKYGNALQAAVCSGAIEVVQLLLDAHANVNAQGGTYDNALQAAIYRGEAEIVQLLLEANADVNALGKRFGAAREAAISMKHTNIVQLLVDYCPDFNTQQENYDDANVLTGRVQHGDDSQKGEHYNIDTNPQRDREDNTNLKPWKGDQENHSAKLYEGEGGWFTWTDSDIVNNLPSPYWVIPHTEEQENHNIKLQGGVGGCITWTECDRVAMSRNPHWATPQREEQDNNDVSPPREEQENRNVKLQGGVGGCITWND